MALTTTPITFARGIVAASGTSVAVTTQPPDNCHTVLVTNPSTTVVGLVGLATAPAALTAGVNAQRVPPGTTITLGLGTSRARGLIATLVADSIGGAVTLEFTYENRIGGE